MRLKLKAKRFVIVIAVILGCVSASSFSAGAQFEDKGRLEVWTTGPIWRHHDQQENPHVKKVRAARQGGFDRVVFEFEGVVPNYQIRYLKGRYYTGEEETFRIRMAGQAFLQVTFNQISMDEMQAGFSSGANFSPEGKLRMPALREVQEKGCYEGFYDFLLGIKSRRAFRVTEFSNPSRLAIDFKH
jgi:hypothetical protein